MLLQGRGQSSGEVRCAERLVCPLVVGMLAESSYSCATEHLEEWYCLSTWNQVLTLHAERYFELLKESKIRGYLFEQQNYIPKS